MKIIKYISVLLAAAAGLSGCLRDNTDGCPPADGDGNILIQVRVPGMTAKTRATQITPMPREYDIDHLDVLVFEDKGGDADEFLYATEPAEKLTNHPDYPKAVTYVLPLRVSKDGKKQKLVLIANLKDEVAELLGAEGLLDPEPPAKTKGYLMSRLFFETEGLIFWGASGVMGRTLPMWGESSRSVVVTGATQGSAFGTINLMFSMAKVDIAVNANDEYTQAFGLDNFKLVYRRYYNSNTLAFAAPQPGSGLSNGVVKYPSIPTADQGNTLDYGPEGHDTMAPEDYHQPYFLSEVKNKGVGNDECFFVVVGGYYTPEGEPENVDKITFYRIDLYDRDSSQAGVERLDVLRGHHYMINITGVDGPGYDTKEEAENSMTTKMKTAVTVWNELGVTRPNLGGEEDGVLRVSKSEFTFGAAERDENSVGNDIEIFTNIAGGWQVESVTDQNGTPVSWLGLADVSGDPGDTVSTHITAGYYDSETPRYGRINISAGRWTYTVNVQQRLGRIDISPSVINIDFDYYPVPLKETRLAIDSDCGWKITDIDYSGAQTEGWLSVFDPSIDTHPLDVFKKSFDVGEDVMVYSETANFRVDANNEPRVRTAVVHFENEDGVAASVTVNQGWINCGVGGEPKKRMIGGRLYDTHLYGTNVSKIGVGMMDINYFDMMEGEGLKEDAEHYILQLPDTYTLSCFMVENSYEGGDINQEGNGYMYEYLPQAGYENLKGPYYFEKLQVGSIDWGIAHACPEGWRYPNALDINNLDVGRAAMEYYGLEHYMPDYKYWNEERYLTGFGSIDSGGQNFVCYGGGFMGLWHLGPEPDGNGGYKYLQMEVDSEGYMSISTSSHLVGSTFVLAPVRCVEDKDIENYPLNQ